MERRKFVIGAGALATGSAAALGTGAFSSVTAERSIDVEVADDADAYLSLEGNDWDYVEEDGNDGTLTIALDGSNANGDGINQDAVTQIDELFTVQNQGTQEVDVTVEKIGAHSDVDISFYVDDTSYDSGSTLESDGVELGEGDDAAISLEIDTRPASLSDGESILDAVRFNAVATE